ncbi:MAG: hypothetical protein IKK91_10610, partial [Ruminococcus sp.]|nr:hypothetical protein [Ruminococcus sp.]
PYSVGRCPKDRGYGHSLSAPSPTNKKIPSVISALKRFVNKKTGFNIWQRSYYDHIIRNKKEFFEIFRYIENNPLNWINNNFNQNIWR